MNRKPIFAANWKMNLTLAESRDFPQKLDALLKEVLGAGKDYQVVIAPSTTHLESLGKSMGSTAFELGAQNCGTTDFGAFTAENSPVVLKELGVRWVILGHSERRHIYGETNALVAERMQACLKHDLLPMLCIGETLDQRKAGDTLKVVEDQLSILKSGLPAGWESRTAIAYEPVWAIGTGETATAEQAQEVHNRVRAWFSENFQPNVASQMRILYGGSVKPENSEELMACPDVDGFLVGGASLDPSKFANVISNGLKSRPA